VNDYHIQNQRQKLYRIPFILLKFISDEKYTCGPPQVFFSKILAVLPQGSVFHAAVSHIQGFGDATVSPAGDAVSPAGDAATRVGDVHLPG
jgi:hypothetical protein